MDKSNIDQFMFSKRYIEEVGGKALDPSHAVTDFGPFVRQEGRKPLASSGREAMQRTNRSISNKNSIAINHSEFDVNLSATSGFSGTRQTSAWMRSMTR
jgi:hypothetical protein